MAHPRFHKRTLSTAFIAEAVHQTFVLASNTGMKDAFVPRLAEALAKLKPFFDRRNGTVTVGNAFPVTGGAAAML